MIVSPAGGLPSAQEFLDREIADIKDPSLQDTIRLKVASIQAITSYANFERRFNRADPHNGRVTVAENYLGSLMEREAYVRDSKGDIYNSNLRVNTLLQRYELLLLSERQTKVAALMPSTFKTASDHITVFQPTEHVVNTWADSLPTEIIELSSEDDFGRPKSAPKPVSPAAPSVPHKDVPILPLSDVLSEEQLDAAKTAFARKNDIWADDVLIKAGLTLQREIANRSGQDLQDYLTTTAVPAHKEILEEIKRRGKDATDGMFQHSAFVGKQIIIAKDRLVEEITTAAAPIKPPLTPAPVKNLEDTLKQYPPSARKIVTDELAQARENFRREAPSTGFFGKLKNWFNDAADTGRALGRAVSAEVKTRTENFAWKTVGQRAAAAAVTLSVAGVTVSHFKGGDEHANTVAIDKTPAAVQVAEKAPKLDSGFSNAVFRPAEKAFVAAEEKEKAEAPVRTVSAAKVFKAASHVEPVPAPKAPQSLTLNFNDGTTLESKNDAGVWSRMCQKGFDICKNLSLS